MCSVQASRFFIGNGQYVVSFVLLYADDQRSCTASVPLFVVVSLVRSSGSQRFLENSVEVIVHKRHRLNRSNESEPLTAPSKPGGGD